MTSESKEYAYLDYAAMAPLSEVALEAMEPYLKPGADAELLLSAGMNPNSLHLPGRTAFKALEDARRILASAIGSDRPGNVHFTSGATEADNACISGIAKAAKEKLRLAGNKRPCRVLTSEIEHDAVLNAVKALSHDDFEVEMLGVDRDGFVDVRTLEEAFDRADAEGSRVILVSIQTANSEIGSIQAISQLCATAHDNDAYFHTDATQALGKTVVDMTSQGVDAASFSSHKVGGPKGTGALFIRGGVPFTPLIVGGGQESGYRSGTQDVCSAAGFAAAAKAAVLAREDEVERLMALRDKLYSDLQTFDAIEPTVEVEEGSLDYLPNIVNVIFDGYESETLVVRYDSLGFGVSGGSACASQSAGPSHVIEALGLSKDQALGELRISMGKYTTSSDVDGFLRATSKVLDWERR